MHNRSLIDRQTSLLRHLASAVLIFDDAAAAAADPDLAGIDLSRLRLEAQFSFEKRIAKLRQTLPETCRTLGRCFQDTIRQFVRLHPPSSYRRYEDAKLFYEFLRVRWAVAPPAPPYLADVARLEMAIAKVKTIRLDNSPGSYDWPNANLVVRRSPGVELLICDYDIRMLMKGAVENSPDRRPVHLAIYQQKDHVGCSVVELPTRIYHALEEMTDWVLPEDRLAAGLASGPVVEKLLEKGLLEAPS